MNAKRSKAGTDIEITDRDVDLFQKLNAAGWLTTHQILRYFFPAKSANAVSKRLRKLINSGFLAIARTSSTEQALYRLAGKGRLALVEQSSLDESEIRIPTQLPRKLKHFAAINDLRFYFEQLHHDETARLLFFFSERELNLQPLNLQSSEDPIIVGLRKHHLVPDAIAKAQFFNCSGPLDLTLALEVDIGTEHAVFFARTKVEQYAQLFNQIGGHSESFRVLTFVPKLKRLIALMRETVRYLPPKHLFYFALLEKFEQPDWNRAAIFLEPYDFFMPVQESGQIEVKERITDDAGITQYALLNLPATSPCRFSLREERQEAVNS